MTMLSVRREVGEFRKRYKWMALAVCVAFSFVLTRLVQLQVVEHVRWAAEAQDNITRSVRLPAVRGLLRDRNGVVLATNRPSYDVYATPQLLDDVDRKLIAKLMGLDEDRRKEFEGRLASVPPPRRSHLIEVFSDVTREQYAALETYRRDLPGVEVFAVPVRSYPYGGLAAHAVGFLNEVAADDLERHPERGYRAGQRMGRGGIERAWEAYLRGREGLVRTIVDVRGKPHHAGDGRPGPEETRRDPIPGRDLRLTLDMDLMRSVERAFRGHPSGAAVVVDARTGRIRALFSKPGYDLNEMSGGLSVERRREIEEDPFRPLIDKTVYESYSPGSTFKPFSALAALEDGTLTPAVHYDCPGYYELGRRRFRCSHVHGDVDMRKAIVQSCNVYFYRLAEQVGLDRVASVARDFGFGSVTGLGINTETPGFIPTRDWYTARHNGRYRVGFTLNEAIGQGNTKVSLMQLAMAYAAIANGGTLYVPQIVQAVEGPDGSVVEEFEPRVRRRVTVKPENLAYVIDGMYGVVNDPNGTAFEAQIDGGVPVAGKTGTAQVEVARRERPSDSDPKNLWYHRRSHAWFAGFAPADAPELVIVVLVEHGGHGGKFAAPLGVQILQEALAGTRLPRPAQAPTAKAVPAAKPVASGAPHARARRAAKRLAP